MYCEKCRKKVTLSAFGKGTCNICGKDFMSPQIPANAVCQECHKTHKELCISCGNKKEEC